MIAVRYGGEREREEILREAGLLIVLFFFWSNSLVARIHPFQGE